jgi:hypothetical protein
MYVCLTFRCLLLLVRRSTFPLDHEVHAVSSADILYTEAANSVSSSSVFSGNLIKMSLETASFVDPVFLARFGLVSNKIPPVDNC